MVIATSDSDDGDLPPNVSKLYLKALSASEVKNYRYAISLLEAVLKARPDFAAASLLLRKLQERQEEE